MINYQRADLNITNFISNVNKNQTINTFVFGYKRWYRILYIIQQHVSTQQRQAPHSRAEAQAKDPHHWNKVSKLK